MLFASNFETSIKVEIQVASKEKKTTQIFSPGEKYCEIPSSAALQCYPQLRF